MTTWVRLSCRWTLEPSLTCRYQASARPSKSLASSRPSCVSTSVCRTAGLLKCRADATGTTEDKHRRKKMVQASDKAPSSPTDWGPTCLVISPKSVVGNWAREIETVRSLVVPS